QRQPSAGSTVSSRRMFLATFAHTRQNTTTTRTSARNTDSVSRRVLRLLGVALSPSARRSPRRGDHATSAAGVLRSPASRQQKPPRRANDLRPRAATEARSDSLPQLRGVAPIAPLAAPLSSSDERTMREATFTFRSQ